MTKILMLIVMLGALLSLGMAPADREVQQSAGMTAAETSATADPRDRKWQLNLDPHKVLGSESCAKCHAAETQVWKSTPHHRTFLLLHRNAEAQAIADRLGVAAFKQDSACTQCHYTMQSTDNGLEAVAGISCESCHGAARDWIDKHHDYGGLGVTRSQETTQHRFKRLSESINHGMRNPINVYLLAQSCYRCHTVPDERLVNVGGHKAGSLDFEIVSWSQGSLRHNFVRSHGEANDVSSRERLRQMFVAGMIADLEFSLRATAAATSKAEFGLTAAKRADRAAKRLAAAQKLVQQPLLEEILAVYGDVTLKLNNHQQLTQAADQVNQLGIRFAATVSGRDLFSIEGYIPASERWK